MHLAHNHHISPRRSHVSFSPTNSQCFVLMKPVLGTQRSQDALAHPASPATAPGTWALPEQAEAACLGKALSCRAVTCCLSPAGCVVKVTSSVWESLWKERFLAATVMFGINQPSCQRAEQYLWVSLTSPRSSGFSAVLCVGTREVWFPAGSPHHSRLVVSLLTLGQREPWWMAWGSPWQPLLWGCFSDGAGQGAVTGLGHCRQCETPTPPLHPVGCHWSQAGPWHDEQGNVWDFFPSTFLQRKLAHRRKTNLEYYNYRLKTPRNLEMRELGLPAQQWLCTSVFPLLHPAECSVHAAGRQHCGSWPCCPTRLSCLAQLMCWQRHSSCKRQSLWSSC